MNVCGVLAEYLGVFHSFKAVMYVTGRFPEALAAMRDVSFRFQFSVSGLEFGFRVCGFRFRVRVSNV